jgi:hypothetical protein
MDKNKILKVVGIVAIAVGAGSLYLAGATEGMVVGLVGVVFVAAGLIAAFFK